MLQKDPKLIGVNLIKHLSKYCAENSKMLMKEIKEDK